MSILFCAIFFLVLRYRHMASNVTFHTRHIRGSEVQVENIQPWMTFGYINQTFMIPEEYLKNRMRITDEKYPNITLNKESITSGVPVSIFLVLIKDDVRTYLDSLKHKQR